MRLHHLNAISTCPAGGALMDGRSRSLRAELACHAILVEARDGLVLVDTGLGLRDCAAPRDRLSKVFLALLSPDFREEMTAVRQVRRLGFDPRDVRDVVLTHLDFDHAGGLDDFPEATVHLLEPERAAAEARRTPLDRMRYRPQQWSTRANWRTHPAVGRMTWMGLPDATHVEGLGFELMLVPLIGHTFGHAGVAIGLEDGSWLLQAGDAYFHRNEMDPIRPRCTPGLRAYQWLMEKDRRGRLECQRRLRELVAREAGRVTVVSGHDPVEFERLAGRPLSVPVGATEAGRQPAPAVRPVGA